MRRAVLLVLCLLVILCGRAFGQAPSPILLKPARVFDGADLAVHDIAAFNEFVEIARQFQTAPVAKTA